MAKYYVMGNYTPQAFKGFIGNPNQDRAAAATALSEAVGGKMESFAITRGSFDFVGVVSGTNLEVKISHIKLETFFPQQDRHSYILHLA